MGFDWGSLAGAALGVVGDLFGAEEESASAKEMLELQYEYQKQLAEQQNKYNVENYQHRHQWEVKDLISSGLNPILSANSAGSVGSAGLGSVGLPQAPKYDMGKTMERLVTSALQSKQVKLAEYNAKSDRIKADADMLRAKQEEAKTQSAIELNQSQSSLNMKNIEMLDKNYNLQKLYTDANVREIDQRIINSVMEVNAKVQYYQDLGEAAKVSSAAAMESAHAQAIIAQVAEANGVSQRALNEALQGKASAETKEAYERALKVQSETGLLDWQRQKDEAHNPLAKNPGLGSMFMEAGEILRNGIGGSVNWSIH